MAEFDNHQSSILPKAWGGTGHLYLKDYCAVNKSHTPKLDLPCQHTTLFQRIEQRRNVVFWLSLCCYVVFMLFLCRRCGIRRNSTRYVGFRVPCQPEYNVIGFKIGCNLVMVGRPLHSACQFNE